jgi:hypothetical protein
MNLRIATLTSLLVAVGISAGAAPAHAQGACVFTGTAGLDPGLPAVAADLALDIEQGSYYFQGEAVCAGVMGGFVFAGPTTIFSDGFYDNLYCSTGLAHDTSGAGTTLVPVDDVGYMITFVGGAGTLLLGAGTVPDIPAIGLGSHSDGGTGSGAHGLVTGRLRGSGAVTITPSDDGNCVTSNAGGFNATGAFVAQ